MNGLAEKIHSHAGSNGCDVVCSEKMNDIVATMYHIYKEQGDLPVWHLMGNETDWSHVSSVSREMPDPSAPITIAVPPEKETCR